MYRATTIVRAELEQLKTRRLRLRIACGRIVAPMALGAFHDGLCTCSGHSDRKEKALKIGRSLSENRQVHKRGKKEFWVSVENWLLKPFSMISIEQA